MGGGVIIFLTQKSSFQEGIHCESVKHTGTDRVHLISFLISSLILGPVKMKLHIAKTSQPCAKNGVGTNQ